MKKTKLLVCGFLLSAFALLAVACGAIQQGIQAGQEAANLMLVGQVYQQYCNANKKGPANLDDLIKATTAQNEKDALQQVKDGKFTLIYGVNTADASAGNATKVLGYSSSLINGQRVVLLGNGEVKAIPDAEFQAKPKATPGGAAPPDNKVKDAGPAPDKKKGK